MCWSPKRWSRSRTIAHGNLTHPDTRLSRRSFFQGSNFKISLYQPMKFIILMKTHWQSQGNSCIKFLPTGFTTIHLQTNSWKKLGKLSSSLINLSQTTTDFKLQRIVPLWTYNHMKFFKAYHEYNSQNTYEIAKSTLWDINSLLFQ